MKEFWKIVGRWWLIFTVAFVLQGKAIETAYVERGYLAYGGEYLIVPLVLIIAISVEHFISDFKGADHDRRNNEDFE